MGQLIRLKEDQVIYQDSSWRILSSLFSMLEFPYWWYLSFSGPCFVL